MLRASPGAVPSDTPDDTPATVSVVTRGAKAKAGERR